MLRKCTESEVAIAFDASAVVVPGLGHHSSEDPRDNAGGLRHIFAVTVSKRFQHHSFFSGNSAKKQNPKTDNARETRHAVAMVYFALANHRARHVHRGCSGPTCINEHANLIVNGH
jgi:hypothetical protein